MKLPNEYLVYNQDYYVTNTVKKREQSETC